MPNMQQKGENQNQKTTHTYQIYMPKEEIQPPKTRGQISGTEIN
jgi:hypothetical protein